MDFRRATTELQQFDPEIYDAIQKEETRQRETLQLIAAENVARRCVLLPSASLLAWKTAEGTIGHRHHAGCSVVDTVEAIAEERGRKLFGTSQVWVQPHSGSSANLISMGALLDERKSRRETIRMLAMKLEHGGHLSHGCSFNISGKAYANDIQWYQVNQESLLLDYDAIAKAAEAFRPHLIICGASSYPRTIDYARFGGIAQSVGACLLSDIAHVMGQVVSGVQPDPVPHSTLITTSTYKSGGPRGGLIIAGHRATEEDRKRVTRTVFPGWQGTPDYGSIAAKAVFLKECSTEEYRRTQIRIVENARTLAESFLQLGYDVITGGTDTHMVLINVKKTFGISGIFAEKRLEECGIIANKNLIPFDTEHPNVTSGIRFGTNTVTRIGMGKKEMDVIAKLVDGALRGDGTSAFGEKMRCRVKELMCAYDMDL